jgi:hypothetical protein
MRLVSLFVLILIVAVGGCSHRPAYSDIDANRNSRNQNQNSEAQTGAPSAAYTPPASGSQPGPSPAEPEKIKMPSFMNQAGGIKDLPSYPRAIRVNIQFGPIQQTNVMTLFLHTRDSMEKVQAFYTQVIKDNQWTVSDKLLDPELSEWTLKKGENNDAKVQAKKDPKTGSLEISIVRAEKLGTPPPK